MPPPNQQIQPEMINQVVNLIARGVLQVFSQRFPVGILDPATPIAVQRLDDNGNRVEVVTNMAQLVAELNDNIKELSELTEEALEVEEEEIEPPRKRRRK